MSDIRKVPDSRPEKVPEEALEIIVTISGRDVMYGAREEDIVDLNPQGNYDHIFDHFSQKINRFAVVGKVGNRTVVGWAWIDDDNKLRIEDRSSLASKFNPQMYSNPPDDYVSFNTIYDEEGKIVDHSDRL